MGNEQEPAKSRRFHDAWEKFSVGFITNWIFEMLALLKYYNNSLQNTKD